MLPLALPFAADAKSWPWVLAAVLLVLLWALVGIAMRRRRRDAWREFAKRKKLAYELRDGVPRAWGRVAERAVELRPRTAGSDGRSLGVVDARMSVELRAPLPAELEIGEAGSAQRLLEAERIEVGDETFDPRVAVHGRDPEAVRRWLDPARRVAILRAIDASEGGLVGVSAGRVFIDDRELATDGERLDARLATLLEAARAIDAGNEARQPEVPG